MSRWKIGIAVAILSVLMFIAQGLLMSQEGFTTVRATKQDGWWQIHEEERVPRKAADAMIVADGEIFLFYEDLGLVNAYSTGAHSSGAIRLRPSATVSLASATTTACSTSMAGAASMASGARSWSFPKSAMGMTLIRRSAGSCVSRTLLTMADIPTTTMQKRGGSTGINRARLWKRWSSSR